MAHTIPTGGPGYPMDEPSLLDYLRIFQRRWRLVLVTALLLTGAAAAFAFLVTPQYEAEATALQPPKQAGGGGLGALANLGGLASMLPINLGGMGGSNTADFEAVLESRRVTDQLIAKLHLDKSPEFPQWLSHSDLRLMVLKRLRVSLPGAKDSLFRVRVRSSDAALSASMSNTWMELMLQYLDRSNYRQASKHRRFLEQEIAKGSQAMAAAEQKLAVFQKTNRMVSLPDEAKAYIEQYAKLESEILAARATQSETQARLQATGEKLNGLQSALSPQMTELEIMQRGLGSREAELDRARARFTGLLTGLPAKALDLARLEREVKVQNALYLFLMQQLASARLDEDNDVDLLLQLDRAEVPDRPVFPQKKLIVGAALAAGLVLGLLLALLLEYLEIAREREAGLARTAGELPPEIERRIRTLAAD